MERNASRKKLALKERGADKEKLVQVDIELGEELVSIDNEKDFVLGCNNPGEFMEDDKFSGFSTSRQKKSIWMAKDSGDFPTMK